MPDIHSLPDDARHILHARMGDLLNAADSGDAEQRRVFARRARYTARLLEGPSVGDRSNAYAVAWLKELASRAEAPRR